MEMSNDAAIALPRGDTFSDMFFSFFRLEWFSSWLNCNWQILDVQDWSNEYRRGPYIRNAGGIQRIRSERHFKSIRVAIAIRVRIEGICPKP
jgi:hypothetical protein